MAFNDKQLARQNMGAASDTGPDNVSNVFMYRTTETLAQVLATNYFLAAYKRLRKGMIVDLVTSVTGTPQLTRCVVTTSTSTSVVLRTQSGEGGGSVTSNAANLTLNAGDHGGRSVVLTKTDGQAIVLPAATGSGNRFRVVIGATIASVGTTIKVANATDVMAGVAVHSQDGGDTLLAFETAADTDTVTLNGTTTGGLRGHIVELEDIAAGVWVVRSSGAATGTEATPFSATVA